MKKLLLLYAFISISFALFSAENNHGGTIEGKWQPHDIAITIEGLPGSISTAIAQQIKSDPSSECVKNSIVEVKKNGSYTLTNVCEENGNITGTWKQNGNKLTVTFSTSSNKSETITITSLTEDTITIDITDKIPDDLEFNGIKVSSLRLILKRM
ncbi:MAG: lipocalin family protein [Prevotellaceae bacterium]|jgi:predicted amino acid dehydrogenase|nr:lipocalin family protein [Prevotellaceae bacterium]